MRTLVVCGGLALVVAGAAVALQACDSKDCADLKDAASALVDEAGACSRGDSCALVDMYEMAGGDNCLGAFQCSRPLNASTDLAAFRKRAREIARAYDGCPECVVADCIDPSTVVARCDTAQRRCVVEEKP